MTHLKAIEWGFEIWKLFWYKRKYWRNEPDLYFCGGSINPKALSILFCLKTLMTSFILMLILVLRFGSEESEADGERRATVTFFNSCSYFIIWMWERKILMCLPVWHCSEEQWGHSTLQSPLQDWIVRDCSSKCTLPTKRECLEAIVENYRHE